MESKTTKGDAAQNSVADGLSPRASAPVKGLSGYALDAAVAREVMGWLPPDHADTIAARERQRMTHSAYDTYYLNPAGAIVTFPRYSADIAAAIEVEHRLIQLGETDRGLLNRYSNELFEIVAEDNGNVAQGDFWIIHATAAQRCRAALRAVGVNEPAQEMGTRTVE